MIGAPPARCFGTCCSWWAKQTCWWMMLVRPRWRSILLHSSRQLSRLLYYFLSYFQQYGIYVFAVKYSETRRNRDYKDAFLHPKLDALVSDASKTDRKVGLVWNKDMVVLVEHSFLRWLKWSRVIRMLFEAKSSYFNMPAFVILVFSLSSNGSLFHFYVLNY